MKRLLSILFFVLGVIPSYIQATRIISTPIQYIHYLPYGEILANQRASGYDERFKFTTKELDAESGYYYFGARYLMSELGYFLSTDPLTDKTPEISSYLYCNGNPIRFVDPDGRITIAASVIAQNRLLSTLSCGERMYVSFDKRGNINAHRLNRSKSTSHNMTALKALTNSKVTYNFLVQGKSSDGKTDMKQAGGVTEMYGATRDASQDPLVVNIISGDHLRGEAAAADMAHEAFGHAYMYELTGGDTNSSSHHYEVDINKSYVGEDGSLNIIPIDTNTELQQHINDAVNEATTNYDCGL